MASGNSNVRSKWRPKLPQRSGPDASPGSLPKPELSKQAVGIRSPVEPSGKFLVRTFGKTLNSHSSFIDRLTELIRLQEVDSVDKCDFILGFCPIVSRAGTDLEAAVQKLQSISDIKPTVLVALHPTFDPECVVPDSNRAVNRKNMTTVDCLFYEDQGLLQCCKNNESLYKTSEYIKSKVKNLQNKGKKQGEGVGSEQRNTAKSSDVLFKYPNTEPETSERDSELMDTNKKLPNATEQSEEKNTQLENMKKLLSEKETQLQEKNRLLIENTQAFEMTLQENDKQLVELKELRKTKRMLEENQTQIKDKERQLENMGKELDTSKNELLERDKQLQEKDRLLTENTQTLQVKDEILVEKETLLKQIKTELDKTRKELEDSQRHMEEKNRQLENMKKLLTEKET